MDITYINKLFAVGTICAIGFFFLIVAFWVLKSRSQNDRGSSILSGQKKHPFFVWVQKNALLLAFATTLVSTLGSLFYSEIALYPPCELCWIQRFFMYPLLILLGVTLWNNGWNLINYALGFSLLGFLTALYHNIIYYAGSTSAVCQLMGSGASCTRRYVFEFGFVTIPLMALVAFSLIILLLIVHKFKSSSPVDHL